MARIGTSKPGMVTKKLSFHGGRHIAKGIGNGVGFVAGAVAGGAVKGVGMAGAVAGAGAVGAAKMTGKFLGGVYNGAKRGASFDPTGAKATAKAEKKAAERAARTQGRKPSGSTESAESVGGALSVSNNTGLSWSGESDFGTASDVISNDGGRLQGIKDWIMDNKVASGVIAGGAVFAGAYLFGDDDEDDENY